MLIVKFLLGKSKFRKDGEKERKKESQAQRLVLPISPPTHMYIIRSALTGRARAESLYLSNTLHLHMLQLHILRQGFYCTIMSTIHEKSVAPSALA